MTQPVNKNDPNVLRERPEAYRMALREFYEFKAKQELSEELLKWQRKQDLEANPEKDVQRTGKDGKVVEKRDYSKPYSNGFLYHESKTVEKSAVFEMEQMERNRIQKEQFQKISSFEKAVPQSASGVSDYKKSRPMISIQPSKSPASIQRKPSAPKNDLIGLLNKKRAAS